MTEFKITLLKVAVIFYLGVLFGIQLCVNV